MHQKQKAIISLFDLTGNMVRPWIKRGYKAFIFDLQHPRVVVHKENGQLVCIKCDLSDTAELKAWLDTLAEYYDVRFLCGFPPCTDLAVAGARHFKAKAEANPSYRAEAMRLVMSVVEAADYLGVPGFLENPVSVISTEWRKPDYTFHPADYGGYIPEAEAAHPEYPEIIPPRDAYTKRTCLWTWGDFRMPEPRPVPHNNQFHGWAKLGGKSLRTKNIRSATPRGFAEAVAEANADMRPQRPFDWIGDNVAQLFGYA